MSVARMVESSFSPVVIQISKENCNSHPLPASDIAIGKHCTLENLRRFCGELRHSVTVTLFCPILSAFRYRMASVIHHFVEVITIAAYRLVAPCWERVSQVTKTQASE